jgi:large subunit ribosomal protein L23
MTIYEVIKAPLVTEKSTLLKETGNTYLFEVDMRADKPLIKKSVEQLFKVKVKNVRTSIVPSKVKRFGQAHGRTKAWKKAIVTLASGKIELFEGV